MKIAELIEPLNNKLPARLSNYKITVEKEFDIFKLNMDKNVIAYKSILESDLPNFNPNFFYYLEQRTEVCLYAHQINKIGEINKICLGSFKVNSDKLIFLRFHSRKYKHLIKFIKKALGAKPTMGRTSYEISLRNDFIIETVENYSIPKKVIHYTYKFSDDTVRVFSKENTYIANDIVINNGVDIKSISKKNVYEYEHKFEHKILL